MSYPVFEPYIDENELEACKLALDCKYLGMGSFVGEFEDQLTSFLELEPDRFLITCSTGHAALHLTFLALEVGPGDEIITPSFNNVADLQAIGAVGANPVFCDVEEGSLCIDPDSIEELVTDKTKAIIAMDYGSRLANHHELANISEKLGIPIIHDAAHSFGSRYQSKSMGHQADFTMLSFDPIKNITCIDGGALIVRDEALLTQVREMRLIGMSQRIEESYRNQRDWNYDVHRLGFRYHLANLHASIGLSQLRKFDVIREKRRDLYSAYEELLGGAPDLKTQGKLEDGVVPFIFCLRVPEGIRSGLKKNLLEKGINTGIHWTPGHYFSLYSNCTSGDLTVTNRIAGEIMSLPFYPALRIEDVEIICDAILKYIEKS